MTGIAFDTTNREIVIVNGSFAISNDVSAQNGIIIKDARCINPYNPILGVGFNPINAQSSEIVSEMNRWKKQCIQDGAQVAEFTLSQTGEPMANIDININIKY